MACPTFGLLATATEALQKGLYKRARFQDLWFQGTPRGNYPKGTGVEQTTFTMKNAHGAYGADWEDITLSDPTGTQIPVSGGVGCPTNYQDVAMGFYRRTYGPKRLKLQGPAICRDQLTYQHDAYEFLNGYEVQLSRVSAETIGLAWRSDYIKFIDIFSDGVKYKGPNAIATVVPPTSDITQGQLDIVAADLVRSGATNPDTDGYIMRGGAGMLWTLEIDAMASQRILKNNAERRIDARFAMPNELWRRINATTIISNFRHVPEFYLPRYNVVDGVLTEVYPFKTATEQTSDGDEFSAAYLAAGYEMAIVVVPGVFRAEIVQPETWNFKEPRNYMGEWQWIEGGERIFSSACFDPEHNWGRHFGRFEYAPKPELPFIGKAVVYKRQPQDAYTSDVYAYPGTEPPTFA